MAEPGEPFAFRIEDTPGGVVVRASGEIDIAAAGAFHDALREAVARESRVVVDLTDVRFIDGTGLGALVAARKEVGEAGEIVLRDPSPLVRRLLDLTRLDEVFTVEP